jgi:hypothetical protein
MTRQLWQQWAGLCVLALGTITTASGCIGYICPLAPPPAELSEPCQALPACCRERVHIFMVNGLTILPHVCGSMNGVAGYVEQLGFCEPRVASHYWRWCFQNEIRKIHQEDPEARIVLVGYSIGGSVVYSMAETLEKDGIFIDLIVYLDAHSFIHDLNHRPGNVGKVVSINSSSLWLPGKCHVGEDCHHVDTFWHLALPRKDETLQTLGQALSDLAHDCGGMPHIPAGPPEVASPHTPTAPPFSGPIDAPGTLKGAGPN